MSYERYLINKLKYKYDIKVKKIKMSSSGIYYIAYRKIARDFCIFQEPINNKLYCCLEDILSDAKRGVI